MVKQKFRSLALQHSTAWEFAWEAAHQFEASPGKIEGIPVSWEQESAALRRRAQRLFFGYVRWKLALEARLHPWLRKPPRPRLAALVKVAAYELMAASPEEHPAIVHHAAGLAKSRLSQGESGLANAVLRRFAQSLEADPLSAESAHPEWLLKKWRSSLGQAATLALCQWNQQEPQTFVRWDGEGSAPENWQPSPWPGYFAVSGEDWKDLRPMLDAGQAYVQDPFARHPVELLDPQAGETILDACAAPGGKSRGILRAWGKGPGVLVSADLPGNRMQRLEANLRCIPPGIQSFVHGVDLEVIQPVVWREAGLPDTFDAILIDVPCSNTGVMARRPDIRHLLTPDQMKALPPLQLSLLESVARLLKPWGRLVYSTCSLEPEENEKVVAAFLERHPCFQLHSTRLSRPWEDAHDGGGAFLLVRTDESV